jgi:hypothetical protein
MARTRTPLAPPARLTLRAHLPAPARVELVYRPAPGRLARTVLWLVACWGAAPFLFWFPPHYPWAAAALLGGVYLAFRSWTGRYRVHSFAGICPRCGSPLSLGIDRTIDLPHTVTCFSCHFEPRLEVTFASTPEGAPAIAPLEHQTGDCIGQWETRWLADAPFLFCGQCHAGVPASDAMRRAAAEEEELTELLARLTDEGQPLI